MAVFFVLFIFQEPHFSEPHLTCIAIVLEVFFPMKMEWAESYPVDVLSEYVKSYDFLEFQFKGIKISEKQKYSVEV